MTCYFPIDVNLGNNAHCNFSFRYMSVPNPQYERVVRTGWIGFWDLYSSALMQSVKFTNSKFDAQ